MYPLFFSGSDSFLAVLRGFIITGWWGCVMNGLSSVMSQRVGNEWQFNENGGSKCGEILQDVIVIVIELLCALVF